MARTKVEVALDDPDPSLDSAQWTWTDWTSAVELDQQGVYLFRGYRDGSDDPSATEIRFRGKNGDLRWSLYHANNPYLGRIRKRTPIRVSRDYGAAVVRAVAYIDETNLISDGAGGYKAVDVVAYGRLYFEDAAPESQSVLYGQIINVQSLVSYVPGEDASGSTALRNAVPGQPDAYLVGISPGADAEVTGSKSLWQISEATGATRVDVRPYARPSPEAWSVCAVVKIPAEPAGTTPFFSVNCAAGTIQRWVVQVVPGSPATLQILGQTLGGTDVLTGTTTTAFTDDTGAEPWGRTIGITIKTRQNGTGIDWAMQFHVDTESGGGGPTGTVATQTLGPVTGLSTWPTSAIDGWTMGHWAVFGDYDGTTFLFFNGYRGFDLAQQFFGVAIDADIPVYVSGAATTSTSGPLTVARPIDTLRTIVAGEGGLMYEMASGSVRQLLRSELYNQTVALTVARSGKQILSLYPIEDGFLRANRVTARDVNGDSAVADAPYPLDPTTVGYVQERSIDTNLEPVDQIAGAAQLKVSTLSVQDYRYRIEFEFDGPASALRSTFLSGVDIGSRIQITGNAAAGDHATLDTIDQQVMGIEEFHTQQSYRVGLNTRSAAPWQAFEAESSTANDGRADTRGAQTLVAIDDNDTSVLVGSYDTPAEIGAKFSTTSEPYDLAIRTFDRVTCTNVVDQTCVFVAAGTAAHADNAAITPSHPAGIALGDLELLLCSVRDSTGFASPTGVADRYAAFVGDQIGWKQLVRFGGSNGSFRLYGRTYTGVTAPTITPVSGVAGDTTSAQLAAFRYAQPVIHKSAIPLSNASAANIAYPALSDLTRRNTLLIMVVQKDDDFTSTTAPGGFTKIADFSSTLGTDQGLSWYYQIQTTPTNVAAGSITVTGGAANTSKSALISLVTDVQTLTLTRGVNGAVTDHDALADVRLWRAGRLTR